MPPENKSFHSASGPWFWQPADAAVKERIRNKLIQDNIKGIKTGAFFCAVSIVAFVYGFFMTPDQSGFTDAFEKYFLMAASAFMLAVFGSSTVSTVRYLKKSKQDRFFCRHVYIENKNMTFGLLNHLTVGLCSDDDREDRATVEMEPTADSKMALGEHGMFVMIEDEQRKMMVSPFWFIRDMDLRDPYEDM